LSAQHQVEILDKLYFCKECKAVFLFESDVEDHVMLRGHKEIGIVPFN
jgi:hypothetical protein